MNESILEAILATIFLFLVILIAINIPYLAAKLFGVNNPLLLLETSAFLTYSTSNIGNMTKLVYIQSQPVLGAEFRISPPEKSQGFQGYYLMYGYCITKDLWQELLSSTIDAAISTFLPLKVTGQTGKDIIINLFKYNYRQLFTETKFLVATDLSLTFSQNYLYYYEQKASDALTRSLVDTFSPESLLQTAAMTTVTTTQTIVTSVLRGIGMFGGIGGMLLAFGANFAIGSSLVLYDYLTSRNDEFKGCYMPEFFKNENPNIYFNYIPIYTFPIYFNENFYIIDGCNEKKAEFICDINKGNTPINSEKDKHIMRISLGFYDEKSNKYYYPTYLILKKEKDSSERENGKIIVGFIMNSR